MFDAGELGALRWSRGYSPKAWLSPDGPGPAAILAIAQSPAGVPCPNGKR